MDNVVVQPFQGPASGEAHVPGSKSISNRALILALLSEGSVCIGNLLNSQDTEVLREAFRELGVGVREEDPAIHIEGCAGQVKERDTSIHVENAGTVARFLPAALSLLPCGKFRFEGSEAMMKRPMAGLLDSIRALGSRIECRGDEGFFPFDLHPAGWTPSELSVDAAGSSQILSGLLIAATRAPHPMKIRLSGETVSKPFVEMTVRMIRQFGGTIEYNDPYYEIEPGLTGPALMKYEVEPDASAASYFFGLPIAVGGSTSISSLPQKSLQGDLAFVEVLENIGLFVHRSETSISVEGSPRHTSWDINFNAFSDTFLTLAALSPLLPGPTHITGIAHTRHQETDRITAMATELRKLGQRVEETEDSLTIHPDREKLISLSRTGPIAIETYDDHRVAMSFAILGSHDLHGDARGWIKILNPNCCRKTFPGFFEELARMRLIANSSQ